MLAHTCLRAWVCERVRVRGSVSERVHSSPRALGSAELDTEDSILPSGRF